MPVFYSYYVLNGGDIKVLGRHGTQAEAKRAATPIPMLGGARFDVYQDPGFPVGAVILEGRDFAGHRAYGVLHESRLNDDLSYIVRGYYIGAEAYGPIPLRAYDAKPMRLIIRLAVDVHCDVHGNLTPANTWYFVVEPDGETPAIEAAAAHPPTIAISCSTGTHMIELAAPQFSYDVVAIEAAHPFPATPDDRRRHLASLVPGRA